MNWRVFLIMGLVFLFSCEKDEIIPGNNFSTEINFNVSEWILKDRDISCVDFDEGGNAWVCSGNELIIYKDRNKKSYDVGSGISDISVAKDGTVWIATEDKGLAKFDGSKFSFYNSENSGLPRDYILDVECSPDGSVWFGSSAHQVGGLMHYDGNFTLYTPENSALNQNVIRGLKVNDEGELFCYSSGTVSKAKVFKRDKKSKWQMLDEEMMFYWITAMDITSKSEVVVATDHSLSSCWGCYTNDVAIYRNGSWKILNPDFEMSFFNRMFVDKRDYIWSRSGSYIYSVYDGEKWHHSEKGQIPETFIRSVKVDPNNNIWFCTEDGIFILNQ